MLGFLRLAALERTSVAGSLLIAGLERRVSPSVHPGHPQSDIEQLTMSELTPQDASSDKAATKYFNER
ncbi:MAG: hypothetical protein ACR2LM_11510 [Pyrinomonadaceae bacterium]